MTVFDDLESYEKAARWPMSHYPVAIPDEGISCMGGPRKGEACHGNNSECDTTPGSGDGVCDACTLVGGVTTADEMFIQLGDFYCAPNTDCSGRCVGGLHAGEFCNYLDSVCTNLPVAFTFSNNFRLPSGKISSFNSQWSASYSTSF